MFLEELRLNSDYGALAQITDMIESVGIPMPDPRISSILQSKSSIIDKIVSKNLNYAGISEVVLMLEAMEHWGLRYYLGDFVDLEDDKDNVIRSLLRLYKENRTKEVADIIKRLREEDVDWPELAAIEKSLGASNVAETKQRLDRKCWTGYKKQGTKLKNGVRVNNCVPTNENTAERSPTLYHGTLTKNVPSIMKSGLLPRVGQFTKNIHGDKATPKVFATTEQGARAVYCALASQIFHAIDHMPSAAEMAKMGALLVIHRDAGKFSQYDPSAKDVQGSLEPGDYHSDDAIAVDEVLTGQALLDWIKRHDADRGELEMGVEENFADGKGPGRKGDSQRHGIPKGATIAQLEKAAKASGRKGQLARWQINMRRGRAKAQESLLDEGFKPSGLQFPDGKIFLSGHFFDQTVKPDRQMQLNDITDMLRKAVNKYGHEIANLGPVDLVYVKTKQI